MTEKLEGFEQKRDGKIMKVIFLHGLCGVGKFTIGNKLSKLLKIPLFHNHLTVDMATSLFEFGTEGFKELRATVWLKAFNLAAKENNSFIFTFCPEETVDPELIPKLVADVEDIGGEILFVELKAELETLYSRCESEDRKKFGKLVDANFYRELKEKGYFDFPPMPSCFLEIDTEIHSTEESANIIFDSLKGEL